MGFYKRDEFQQARVGYSPTISVQRAHAPSLDTRAAAISAAVAESAIVTSRRRHRTDEPEGLLQPHLDPNDSVLIGAGTHAAKTTLSIYQIRDNRLNTGQRCSTSSRARSPTSARWTVDVFREGPPRPARTRSSAAQAFR